MNGVVISATPLTTTYNVWNLNHAFEDIEKIYKYTCIPSILFGILTVTLNIFIIRFYWKSELTVVPLLYTLIASFDIICAIGVIYKYIAVLLLYEDYFTEPHGIMNSVRRLHTLDIHAMIFCFLIQVSYRCSVFCNLVLAVSRTIMILNPFYQINIKKVKLACTYFMLYHGLF